jgi:hypothetical protein
MRRQLLWIGATGGHYGLGWLALKPALRSTIEDGVWMTWKLTSLMPDAIPPLLPMLILLMPNLMPPLQSWC